MAQNFHNEFQKAIDDFRDQINQTIRRIDNEEASLHLKISYDKQNDLFEKAFEFVEYCESQRDLEQLQRLKRHYQQNQDIIKHMNIDERDITEYHEIFEIRNKQIDEKISELE